MGRPMAANLSHAGFTVVGYDVDRAALAESGVQAATSPAEVADRAPVVISIVRTRDQTEAALFGEDGLLASEREGLDIIVMSTIDPGSMADIAVRAGERGAVAIDAPVSGGVRGAREGTLSIMVSGDEQAVARAQPLFMALGSRVFAVGARPGMAQAVKLANQLMLASSLMGTLEGLSLAAAAGVVPEQVLPVIAASTGSSWAALNWDDVVAMWEGDPLEGPIGIILKDLRSIEREEGEKSLDLPAARLALEMLTDAWARARL
ncbi:MAG: NAD(P)-dependent oxidoreductase [Candidatus Dormibacteraeota bacterium]|nr:NAD(P)-dependent oxidoreductase [Candidatus Dormibacteraeota bacterium]